MEIHKKLILKVSLIIVILIYVSVTWGYNEKEYDAYLAGAEMSSSVDINTGETIVYKTIWYYRPTILPNIDDYNYDAPLYRLLRDISIIRFDETYRKSKIIECTNIYGGIVRTKLIIGRDIKLIPNNT